jgi:beta-mannosidase
MTTDPLDYGSVGWQWVSQREWWYRARVEVAASWRDALVRLRIKGAMDRADVYLNGHLIGSANGMFDEALLDTAGHLRPGGTNTVAIRVWPDGRDAHARISTHANVGSWRGFQYQKAVRTVGLWRGVDLVATARPAHVKDLFVRTVGDITAASTTATLRVTHRVVNASAAAKKLTLTWTLDGANFAVPALSGHQDSVVPSGEHTIEYDVNVEGDRLRLWWPNGYGSALPDGSRYLYRLSAELSLGDAVLDRVVSATIGIRSLAYRRTTGAPADHYPLVYVVNGEPIYMQGGNWVPSDALYRSDIMSRNYRRAMRLAYEGHVRMLRVWGGGIEEHPEFYELASRYGIMVLQDFWHFYDDYTVDEALWRANADDTVIRLRNYPALAAWTGGNELTGVSEGDRAKAERLPFVQIVRESYDRLDGTRAFFGTTPAGGMCHRWRRIHMVGSEGYESAHGPPCDFLSELGMNSAPAPSTLVTYEGSRAAWVHRAMGTEYLHPNEFGSYRDAVDLAGKTQLAQGIGMAYNMGWAKARRWSNSGALVWAYNDMAPMVGWAVVDYEGEPKASYYLLKREFAPIAVRAGYDRYWFAPGESFTATIDVINDTTRPLTDHTVSSRLMALDGRTLARAVRRVTVPPNADGGVLHLGRLGLTAPRERGVFVLVLDVIDPSGRRLARGTTLFTTEPNRSLYTLASAAHPAALTVRTLGTGHVRVTNGGSRLAYGVDVVTQPGEYASDDYFTLLPGESATVRVTGGPVSVSQIGAARPSVNLALGRPAYGSQDDYLFGTGITRFSLRQALYTTDGDVAATPSWVAETTGRAWLTVDLGSPQLVSRVDILWGGGHGTAYWIEVSDDGFVWRVAGGGGDVDGGRHSHRLAPTTTRFIRLHGTASTGVYDVREIEIYAA